MRYSVLPSVARYGNVVRRLARQMKAFGFGGDRQIAMSLTPIGWKPSKRSVGRFCKERDSPQPSTPGPVLSTTTVQGRCPNHLWLADITRIPTVFPFFHLHLTAVLDAFSRIPLKVAISYFEPSAQAMLDLVGAAIAIHGKPQHFVPTRGSQFIAEVFRAALEGLGIRQRFGALYQHGSIALIERFFKTLKTDLRVTSRKAWGLAEPATPPPASPHPLCLLPTPFGPRRAHARGSVLRHRGPEAAHQPGPARKTR